MQHNNIINIIQQQVSNPVKNYVESKCLVIW